MLEIAAGLLALLGSSLALVAAIGLLRLPGFLARTHAASLAGSVGAGLVLIGVALVAPNGGIAIRALAAILLLFLTTPIAAHLLAKASYRSGETPDGPEEDRKGQTPDAMKEGLAKSASPDWPRFS